MIIKQPTEVLQSNVVIYILLGKNRIKVNADIGKDKKKTYAYVLGDDNKYTARISENSFAFTEEQALELYKEKLETKKEKIIEEISNL